VVYVQQAAAAKTIGILVKLSTQIAELFLSVRYFEETFTLFELKSDLFNHFLGKKSCKWFIIYFLQWVMKSMLTVSGKHQKHWK
jgi:hypothetical protein